MKLKDSLGEKDIKTLLSLVLSSIQDYSKMSKAKEQLTLTYSHIQGQNG